MPRLKEESSLRSSELNTMLNTSSILFFNPIRRVWISGLESSGTRWLAETILGDDRWNGEIPQCAVLRGVQIHHVSLPWGSECAADDYTMQNITALSKISKSDDFCQLSTSKRIMINLTKVLETDKLAALVLIVRDRSSQESSAFSNHCNNSVLLHKETQVGEQIMRLALKTFPDRVLLTHYEDFCWRRSQVATEISSFLGFELRDASSFTLPSETERPCEART